MWLEFDKLCSECGFRNGSHFESIIGEIDCPTTDGDQDFSADRKKFKDSGKLRSKFCDRRNHPAAKNY